MKELKKKRKKQKSKPKNKPKNKLKKKLKRMQKNKQRNKLKKKLKSKLKNRLNQPLMPVLKQNHHNKLQHHQVHKAIQIILMEKQFIEHLQEKDIILTQIVVEKTHIKQL